MLKLPETMAPPSDSTYRGLGHPLRLLPPPKVIEVSAEDCWETEPIVKLGILESAEWPKSSNVRPQGWVSIQFKNGPIRSLRWDEDDEIGRSYGGRKDYTAGSLHDIDLPVANQQQQAPIVAIDYGCSSGLGAIGQHE